ncbi:hypothetical protein KR054_004184 [Drosophila jambulina]|nr:hypothetical protein KR054_004184 [Drosophila jambulina]
MNSLKNFLVFLGLFPIFWLLPDGALAKPLNKKGHFFNYDDELDYFQLQDLEKPSQRDELEPGKNLYQMPAKPVLSEDDAELALMTDMSIYTDNDVAWEHEHGRSGVFRGPAKEQKLRSPPVSQKPLSELLPMFPSNPLIDVDCFDTQDILDSTDMSIGKWNWMEKILRQQALRL